MQSFTIKDEYGDEAVVGTTVNGNVELEAFVLTGVEVPDSILLIFSPENSKLLRKALKAAEKEVA